MKKSTVCKLAATAMAATMTAVCLTGCGTKNYAENNTEYFIGASGPLTGSYSVYGIAVENAAKLAVEEINAELANKEGAIKFKFEMKDDTATTTNVSSNFATLYEKGMQASLGCVTTGSCLEYKNYAKDEGVFCITPSATGDDVTKDADNMFQMCFSDSNQGAVTVNWMLEDNHIAKDTKIGVLYCNNDAYSRGIYNTFKASAEQSGYTITTAVSFTNDAKGNPPADFSSQVQSLKDCEFIFMPVYYTPAAMFMTEAQKSTMSADAKFFGCDGFDGIDAMENFDLNTIKQEISMLSHFNSAATEGKAGEFIAKYKTKYGILPNQFGAAAYDCVYAIAKAIETAKANGKEVPANISAQDMNTILQEVFLSESFSVNGVTGTNIKWNADGTVNKKASKFMIKAKNAD